jgi:stearoyl-CoA desaturase (delta-9 desaturase)
VDIFLHGLLPISWGAATLLMLALTHATILTVTLYLHRSCAHRAVEFHPALVHAFRFWSWVSTGMTARLWASVHRKHHAKCETVDDPHSPQQLGLRKVLFSGVDLYRAAARDPETTRRYGSGTPSGPLEDFYEKWANWGMVGMIALEALLFGVPKAAFIGGLQLAWIPFWAAGIVNGVGHYWGYRNHDSDDASRNISPIGFIIGGEELHNNHHAFPSSAKLSFKRWEFDWGWGVIQALSALKLARVKRVAPQVARAQGEITLDTLKALAACRFQAMDEARRKLAPFVRSQLDALPAARDVSRRHFMRWFFFDKAWMPSSHQEESWTKLLEAAPALATMRSLLVDLTQTWSRTNASAHDMVEHFKAWCHAAEASGVEAMAKLSASLRSYRLAGE